MSKIDEVARKIYERRNGHGCNPWSRLPRAHQEPYLGDARAAIEAMREPTDAMKFAGGLKCEALMFEGEGSGVIFDDMGWVFGEMIDAALSEVKG